MLTGFTYKTTLREGRAMIGTIWIVAFGALGFALSSCTATLLPLHTTVDALKIRKTPLTAALVMPDVLRKSSSRKSAFPTSRAGRRWLGQKSANE